MSQGKRRAVRVVSSETSFRGPVFSVATEMVQEPGGIVARRDVVRHPGSVVVLPVDGQDRVLLERQYRHAARAFLWELPAGRKDANEPELAAAQRELLEETGFTAKEWKRILRFYVSPGFLDETMALFLARGLNAGKAEPEEDEKITVRFFSLSAALKMVGTGRIMDAKTIVGVLWLATHRARP
jgi:ADP-ribose pyrophosphatase